MRPRVWHGTHDLKVGIDLDRLRYDANYVRTPISYLRESETPPGQTLHNGPAVIGLFALSVFPGTPSLTQHNTELSG